VAARVPTGDGVADLSVPAAVRQSLGLLSDRERRRYSLAVAAQMATSLLDLFGVVLMGVVALVATGTLTVNDLPVSVQEAISSSGWEPSPEALAVSVALLAALLLLLKTLAYGILVRRIFRFLGRCLASVSERATARFYGQSLLMMESRTSQSTAFALTSGLPAAILGVLGSWSIILSEVALLGLLGSALLVVSPVMSLFTGALFAGVGFALHRGLEARSNRVGQTLAETSIKGYQAVQDDIATFREVHVTGRRMVVLNRIQGLLSRGAIAQADSVFMGQIPKLAYESALIVGAGIVMAWQFATGGLSATLTILAIYLTAGARAVPSMLRLSGQLVAIRISIGQASRAYTLWGALLSVDSPIEGAPDASARVSKSADERHVGFVPQVELKNVSFRYPGADSPSVRDVSLVVQPGTSLALVGSSGAGKSTLADLILGVHAVDAGTALVSGVPPQEAITRWPGALAYVPQHVALVDGSVRSNVAIGIPGADIRDDEVWNALQQASLAEFLSENREGLDTLVGERGVRLSGGQRQRLGLARALYSRPKLLVLDEATSALDSETEAAIVGALLRQSGQVTRIMVAHRLASVLNFDSIAFVTEGRIVARGTFDEVVRANADFASQARILGLVP